MGKAKSPHKAQLSISLAIYPILKDGSLDSVPLPYSELSQTGLKERFLIEIDGFDLHETIRKVHEAINGLKK